METRNAALVVGVLFMLLYVSIVVSIFGIVAMNNVYITLNGAKMAVSAVENSDFEIVGLDRNIFSYSIVTIKMKDGNRKIYELDSNVLFNVVVKES